MALKAATKNKGSKATSGKGAAPAKKSSKAFPEETEVYLAFDRSTKGTHVFVECDESGELLEQADCVLPTVYIRKEHTSDTPPDMIKIIIQTMD